MDRSSFGTRARQRIGRETCASIKGRVNPYVIGVMGIAVAGAYSWFELHKQISETIKIGLISGLGANVIWLLGALIYNTIRVPWLLDAESGVQIDILEKRATAAESALDDREKIRQENSRLHLTFAHLADMGAEFLKDINRASTRSEFALWDEHFQSWLSDVQSAMRNAGFPYDAVEFIGAKESAPHVFGAMDFRNEQERRRRILKQHQEYLGDFVRRRLS